VFKAFTVCPYDNLKLVIIGQDCYPDIRNGKPVATGIAFANRKETSEQEYSPSLKILMESFIDFSVPHSFITFDPSLEEISKQGVLLINTALTCDVNRPGSHMLLWRPFIKQLLINLSRHKTGIVYVLLGSEAQSLKDCIDNRYNYILCDKHPAYYARMGMTMPSGIWKTVNDIIKSINGKEEQIKWFKEEDPSGEGQCEEEGKQEGEECNTHVL
jgi:uracil-DNA glycosylase